VRHCCQKHLPREFQGDLSLLACPPAPPLRSSPFSPQKTPPAHPMRKFQKKKNKNPTLKKENNIKN
ncbi:hypothetical protein ACVGW7_00115, partial [Enterobacter intestinihominis]